MRGLLYLLTLALSYFLKIGYCVISYENFIKNKEAMDLVKQHYNIDSNKLCALDDLLKKLKELKLKMSKSTLQKYVKIMREAGGGTPNFPASASASGNPGSSILNEASKDKETMEANKFLAEARQRLYERQHEVAMQSVPGFDATPYLPQSQSTRWTGGTNFSNASSQFQVQQPTGSTAYYGGAMPFQQVPPMPATSFPALQNHPFNQSGPLNSSTTDSLDWSGGNSQNEDLYSVVNMRKRSSSKEKGKSVFKPRK